MAWRERQVQRSLGEGQVLTLVEAGVGAAAGQQLLVSPFLEGPSPVDDEDPVHELDCGETMGDDGRGALPTKHHAAVSDSGSKVMGREKSELGDEKTGEGRWVLAPYGV